jgi:hypothetical protein
MILGCRVWILLFVAVSCLAGLSAGCSAPAKGEVEGTVTLDGAPLDGGGGAIVFTSANGAQARGTIGQDGSYFVDGVTPGPNKITLKPGVRRILPPELANRKPDGRLPPMELLKKVKIETIAVPSQYQDVERTPLTIEVTSGAQTYDIAIKSDGSDRRAP